ncbi:multicopper oxidase domain-containing protein [Methylocella tundrae]
MIRLHESRPEWIKPIFAGTPGPALFHCHQQLHMDFGFMALFKYA